MSNLISLICENIKPVKITTFVIYAVSVWFVAAGHVTVVTTTIGSCRLLGNSCQATATHVTVIDCSI